MFASTVLCWKRGNVSAGHPHPQRQNYGFLLCNEFDTTATAFATRSDSRLYAKLDSIVRLQQEWVVKGSGVD